MKTRERELKIWPHELNISLLTNTERTQTAYLRVQM